MKLDNMQVEGQIIGGIDATGQEDFTKSIVSLYDTNSGALCTASLLSDSILVTAAHCVDGSNKDDLRIIYGVDLESTNIAVSKVDDYVISPSWAAHQNDELNTGDIALVHFSTGLAPGYAPATVLGDATALHDGQTITLAGYGLSDGVKQTGSGRLRYVDVSISKANYSASEVLLDQTKGKGACHGDSGGPAYVNVGGKQTLWGITSRGVNDPKNDCSVSSAYTNIVYYSKWIAKTSKILNVRGNHNAGTPAPVASAAVTKSAS
jgi:secreted trypsin-like serine protease